MNIHVVCVTVELVGLVPAEELGLILPCFPV